MHKGPASLGFCFFISFFYRLVLLQGHLLLISFSLGLSFAFNLCVAAGIKDLFSFLALYLS